MNTAVGCLLVTHFPVKAELARRPDLSGRAVAIASGDTGRRLVVDASPEAQGVRAGQTITAALAQCPEVTVLTLDDQYLASFSDALQASVFQVADRVQPDGYGRFYLDLMGLADMYGGSDGLGRSILAAIDPSLQPRLGCASGKFPAHCAAASAGANGRFTAPADTAGWLARWPVSWLPLDRSVVSRLYGFGIATLGDVAAMESHILADFLGAAGHRAWRLAHGIDDDPVVPAALPEVFRERLEFPFPVDTVPGWEAGIQLLAQRVWNSPGLRGRAATEVSVEGSLATDETWRFERKLRTPVGSSDSLVSMLLAALNARDGSGRGRWPETTLADMSLTVSGLVPLRGRQTGLWPEERRGAAVPVIPGVERAVILSQESPLPERRWALGSELSPLGEAHAVSVAAEREVPRAVASRGVRNVVDLWEVDTEWWLPAPARRRYWQLVVEGGGLLTVYLDLETGRWYRQGY